MPVVSDGSALLASFPTSWNGGRLGIPKVLTYSFESQLPVYPNAVGHSDLVVSTFSELDEAYKGFVRAALKAWADASGLVFVEAPSGLGSLRFFAADQDFTDSPWRVGPLIGDASPYDGEIIVPHRTGIRSTWDPTHLLLHEIGHMLGLKHPQDGLVTLNQALDVNTNTVMHYPGADGMNLPGALGDIDRQAIALLYGGASADAQLAAWSINTSTWVLTQTGSSGGDVIYGGYGQDSIVGGDGDDVLGGNHGADTLEGGTGADSLLGGMGDDQLSGGDGADTLNGGQGYNVLFGGAGDDELQADGGGDTLDGGAGADRLISQGNNLLIGGAGDDRVSAMRGYATIQFAGPSTSFTITKLGPHYTQVVDNRAGSPLGTDLITGGAWLRFDDRTIPVIGSDARHDALAASFDNILRVEAASRGWTLANSILQKIAANTMTAEQAIAEIVKAADATTSVATLAYQFFTGKIPGLGGIDYLVSPTGPNPNNLNSAYYQSFNMENRYINFAVNLGKVGEGAARFTTDYGGLSLFEATKKAYGTIFGGTPTDAKVTALLAGGRDLYFASYGGDGVNGQGTKAAMVGWLLAEAAKADLGMYARANDAFLMDLADGATFAVDLVGAYGRPEFSFNGG